MLGSHLENEVTILPPLLIIIIKKYRAYFEVVLLLKTIKIPFQFLAYNIAF